VQERESNKKQAAELKKAEKKTGKKRGRPLGSRNKPKVTNITEV